MAFDGILDDLKERWSQIPKWQKWIGFFILLLSFSFLVKIKVIDPLNFRIANLERQVNTKKMQVSRLKILEKKKKKLEEEIALLQKKIQELEGKLPTGREEVSNIIKSIAANIKGIKILSITRGKKTSQQYYDKITYEVIMKTRYPNFLSWCEGISKANRILTFGDVTFNALRPEKKEKEIKIGDKKFKETYYDYKYTVQVNLNLDAYTMKR